MRAPPPFLALHAQEAREQADTKTDKANNTANQQEGITGHGSGNSTDPADSGGEHLGNGADEGCHSHNSGRLLRNTSFLIE